MSDYIYIYIYACRVGRPWVQAIISKRVSRTSQFPPLIYGLVGTYWLKLPPTKP